MTRIAFRKMHGLGNDFVVLDQRRDPHPIGAAAARALADRHTGIGCDQVLLLEPPRDARAQVFLRILNPDGSEAEACGNGTRCVAALIARETGRRTVQIETAAGLLPATLDSTGIATVDMGEPRFGWRDIPLSREMDTLHVDLRRGPLADPVCTNIGNPHATFFVADADAIARKELEGLGSSLETDPLFPERANIGVATVKDRATMRFRVWERGAGITRACGSGACAAMVAAHRRGLVDARVTVLLDGGELEIAWPGEGHVLMAGPAATSFEGYFDSALLEG
ncbi:MAG TPA: diaminopimelate epimerase [Stellaceae bacterium]|jgi:diaminopimelate epimerase|nr:diaminopimelate epimerase [Stellaceae bacterium]